jgi:hypothetical protein
MANPIRRVSSAFFTAAASMLMLSLLTGCRPPTPTPVALDPGFVELMTMQLSVPQHVRRLAVWYPKAGEQDLAYGYSRLEEATFQLKRERSWIKIGAIWIRSLKNSAFNCREEWLTTVR